MKQNAAASDVYFVKQRSFYTTACTYDVVVARQHIDLDLAAAHSLGEVVEGVATGGVVVRAVAVDGRRNRPVKATALVIDGEEAMRRQIDASKEGSGGYLRQTDKGRGWEVGRRLVCAWWMVGSG